MANKGIGFPEILKPSGNSFPIASLTDISGHKGVNLISDLFLIPDHILSASGINDNNDAIGQCWYVFETKKTYQLLDWNRRKNINGWSEYAVSMAVEFGEVPPDNPNSIWVTEDLEQLPTGSSGGDLTLEAIQRKLDELNLLVQKHEYGFSFKLDAGDLRNFAGSQYVGQAGLIPEGGIYEQLPDPAQPPGVILEDGRLNYPELEPTDELFNQPNIKHICNKIGKSTEMKDYQIQNGELVYIKDKNYLYIGLDGKWKLINGSSSGGGEPEPPGPNPDPNKPMEFIDLIVEGSTKTYRVKATDEGKLKVYDSTIDTAEDQKIITENAECLRGLMLSMIYAGPEGANAESYNPVSHSFIEIYNSTSQDINLKGVSLQIGTTLQTWNVYPLKGIIPSKHCFLIRCNPTSTIGINTTRVVIDRYDMDIPDLVLTNKGLKAFLFVGKTDCNTLNPWSSTGFISGYIDLVGLKNRDVSKSLDINGFESAPASVLTDNCGAFRLQLGDYNLLDNSKVIIYGDTNNNDGDWASVDFSKDVDIENSQIVYKPFCTSDGPKDMFYNRSKFDPTKPNMVTHSIGGDKTTRTFNWISIGYFDEFLKYRKVGDSSWLTLESNKTGDYQRKRLKGVDGTYFTVHKLIVKNLPYGEYEYMVGKENGWSDTYKFKVENVTDKFKFVHVSDQQGWTWGEYNAWALAAKKIIELENGNSNVNFPNGNTGIHFLLNTGDMTQNGNRPSEWLDYYNSAKQFLPNVPQMNVVGNNDLCPFGSQAKVNPDSFEWFYCYEYEDGNKQMTTDGSEIMKSVYAFDYGCAHFIIINSNNYIDDQKTWFETHMQRVKSRPTPPKWYIACTHDAPFNITTDYTENAVVGSGKRDTKLNQASDEAVEKRFTWSRLLENHGIRLCLSGHKHTYSRTFALKETVVDPSTNANGLPVNYLRPTYDPNNPSTGDGVTYVMSQATGWKLQSNKDVPTPGIEWLAKYFPGANNVNNADQKAPTFIVFEVDPTQIVMKTYQVNNVTDGGKWDHWAGIQPGKTDLNNITVSQIDTLTLTYR